MTRGPTRHAGSAKGRTVVAVMAEAALDEVTRRDALAERLLQATLGTWDIASVFLGHRLELYRALSEVEPATSSELAAATGTVMRSQTLIDYAQEAGFNTIEILPLDHLFFRFYLLSH
jgi:hypothetical protein